MNRRKFLGITTAMGAAALFVGARSSIAKTYKFPPEAKDMTYEVVKADAEWQQVLTDMQYKVLRHEDTERAFTSALNDEKRVGVFHCAGCDLPAYDSATKFDSGTGWPSFYQEIEDAVRTKEDKSFFSTRTEVHCRRCGGHFGHIFEDGPEPTGLRHCLNGAALSFKAAEA
ncbi:peptide-methionine (R)-S-oxide reductase MsrB [Lentilitoribacter sp. Alg239-R112]|uniref:peptide-methionine (R)-S-oxide reductase MsrB n=1 Tax=Lentilitoribacter sp. Alg239-R112 TaxID=2305987 RepID=UPI0013A6BEA0|nr:peptide-methionine (R)-S-oxide reductase MsrB [Lentilitoribacter sp. Alg239-R112]